MIAWSPSNADALAEAIQRACATPGDVRQADNVDQAYPPFSFTNDREAREARRVEYLAFIFDHREPLFETYRLWNDLASRDLFVALLLFRALGHEWVRLPSNNATFWQAKHLVDRLPSSRSPLASADDPVELRHFDRTLPGAPDRIDCLPVNVLFTFLLCQYHLRRHDVTIEPGAGDHVIDAGACFGDTAIDFARAVGRSGRVYSFDVVARHLQIVRHNLEQNPDLQNVQVHPVGLSDRSRDGHLASRGLDPGFSVSNDCAVPLQRIDDLVDAGVVEQVDMIKMDIEGHELPALRGAERTLRRFKPRLAISIYHHWEDYFRIPIYLNELGLGYRFYLDNYTISDGETVLYGEAKP